MILCGAALFLPLLLAPCTAVQLLNLQNKHKWVPVYEIIPGRQYWTFPLTNVHKTSLAFNSRSQRWELEVALALWSEKSLSIAQSLLVPRFCRTAQGCLVSPLPAQSLRIFLRGLRPHPLHKSSAWSKIEGVLPPSKSFHFPVTGSVLRRLRKWQARGHPIATALDQVSVFVDSNVLDRVDLQRLTFHLDPSAVNRIQQNEANLTAAAKQIVAEEMTRIQEKEGRFAGGEMAQMAFETVRLKLIKLTDMLRPPSAAERSRGEGAAANSTPTPPLKGLLPELRIKVVMPWSLRFLRRKALTMNDDQGCERIDCI